MNETDYKSQIQNDFRVNENVHIIKLVNYLAEYKQLLENIHSVLIKNATNLRKEKLTANTTDAIMTIYPLSSIEGQGLLGMAEALIRIPNYPTAYKLLADKLKKKHWFVKIYNNSMLNIYAFGLTFSKFILKNYNIQPNLLQKILLPFITITSKAIIKRMATQFVVAETIEAALVRVEENLLKGRAFSFDMLGEVARSKVDAEQYFKIYQNCLDNIAKNLHKVTDKNLFSVSIKLSSLNPRYDALYIVESFDDLYTKIFKLCEQARDLNIPLFIDAEEANKVDFSFKIFKKILRETSLTNWQGLGIVIQAYQKRAFSSIDYIYNLAKINDRKIFVRLVKGAYWDTEIKLDQVNGVSDFTVFTRKEHTDISYMACVKKLANYTDRVTPCFATHNLHTINFVKQVMKNKGNYEFQALFGMGDDVYKNLDVPVRVYAPVGNFKDLLPYLVRRLLENGAKTNFVNAIIDTSLNIEQVIENPIIKATRHEFSKHPYIKLPKDIFIGENRINSTGVDMSDLGVNNFLVAEIKKVKLLTEVMPIINGENKKSDYLIKISNPSNLEEIGICHKATNEQMDEAINIAFDSQDAWNKLKGKNRSFILKKMADKLEENTIEMVAILAYEAGKTIRDGILEVREAVDFLRYYAERAEAEFSNPMVLPSVDGERNSLQLEGRGVFLCIAPWNFPLAIFLGQIAGALAAGNTVLAKPAEATNIIGYKTIKMFLEVGLPKGVLHFIPGYGSEVGNYLLNHPKLGGVAFTGSDITARNINKTLAMRDDAILPLIAETGGQNAMIVDSSALQDQVARDVVFSAFQSAGQRCSALRVLYIQEDIFNEQITMIEGATKILKVGLPWEIATDVGPIINQKALEGLIEHKKLMLEEAELLFEVLNDKALLGYFFTPCAFLIPNISILKREVFGPILHVIKYKASELSKIITEINSTGYGLTFGVHTRIDDEMQKIVDNIKAGNIYVNRNQIGAVVGSQPFGGRGKSGTGPKAGGPYYLHRFATEKTLTIDVTASGGNIDLLNKAL